MSWHAARVGRADAENYALDDMRQKLMDLGIGAELPMVATPSRCSLLALDVLLPHHSAKRRHDRSITDPEARPVTAIEPLTDESERLAHLIAASLKAQVSLEAQ
jgi:hypothetical protein